MKSISMRLVIVATALALGACAGARQAEGPSELERVRSELAALQSDPQLSSLAPVAIREAELAVEAAANAEEDTALRDHLVFVADTRVDIAEAQAMRRLYVNQREDLSQERDRLRLQARTQEAEQARREARLATRQATVSREESEQLRREIRELEEMDARRTDQGMVLTLRDVLFDLDQATLKPGGRSELDRLAEFLKEYENRDIFIQGHTDSTGPEDYNLELSEQRARAVKEYLVSQGIDSDRIRAAGRGESMPIASNETPGGRQLNRRVEIVIENPGMAAR